MLGIVPVQWRRFGLLRHTRAMMTRVVHHSTLPTEKEPFRVEQFHFESPSRTPDLTSSPMHAFRQMAPYMNAHRNTTIVIHLSGELIASSLDFSSAMQDIALCRTLGIRLVMVAGARPQIQDRMMTMAVDKEIYMGIRVTPPCQLQAVVDAAGYVRATVESSFSHSGLSVASGNYVVARPLGILNGLDYHHTGLVRRIEEAKIHAALDQGELVLLGHLGYSGTGEIFNCLSEDVATEAAIALGASKLLYLQLDAQTLIHRGRLVHSLTLAQAQQILGYLREEQQSHELVAFQRATRACMAGVTRVHVISRYSDGALVQELFTRDGQVRCIVVLSI